MTGGVDINISDVLSGGLSSIERASEELKSEKEQLQKRLDEGTLSQDQFDKSVEELGRRFSPQEIGEQYVTEMIQGGIAFVGWWVCSDNCRVHEKKPHRSGYSGDGSGPTCGTRIRH